MGILVTCYHIEYVYCYCMIEQSSPIRHDTCILQGLAMRDYWIIKQQKYTQRFSPQWINRKVIFQRLKKFFITNLCIETFMNIALVVCLTHVMNQREQEVNNKLIQWGSMRQKYGM